MIYYVIIILFVSITAAIIYFEMNDESDTDQTPVENPEVLKPTKVKKPYKPKVKKNNIK